jgi:hypothetical protein
MDTEIVVPCHTPISSALLKFESGDTFLSTWDIQIAQPA